jgi:hypothetical protein
LDGTNFSKNSCNRACATENETWSLGKSQVLLVKSQMLLDKSQMLLVKSQVLLVKSQMLLVIVIALCSLIALIALCGGY